MDPAAAAGASAAAGGREAFKDNVDAVVDGGSVAELAAANDAAFPRSADEGVCGACVADAAAVSADAAAIGCPSRTSCVSPSHHRATPVLFALRWATVRATGAAAPSVGSTVHGVSPDLSVTPAGSWMTAWDGPENGSASVVTAGRRTGDTIPTEASSTAMASAAPAS